VWARKPFPEEEAKAAAEAKAAEEAQAAKASK
jgi:hypothetical protein